MFHVADKESKEPIEEMQESLSKLPPDAKENLADKPAVEICTRDTASSNMPLKKHLVERIGQEHWSKPQPGDS